MELTTKEAAERLSVSQRQVERLVVSGSLTGTRRVGRAWMLDASSLVALSALSRIRGRPWNQETAWAALWRLSGLGTSWLDPQASRRLIARLRSIDPDGLAWMCRNRAQVQRFRASESFLAQLSSRVRPSGANAVEPGRDLLAPRPDQVDGYVTTSERDDLVRDFFLVPDTAGNVRLRTTDSPVVAERDGVMPVAVVGVDLLESADPRESAVGRNILKGLMA